MMKHDLFEGTKKEIVRQAIATGNASKVARQHGISRYTVHKWVNQFRDEVEKEMDLPSEEELGEKYTELKEKYDRAERLLGEKELQIQIMQEYIKTLEGHSGKKHGKSTKSNFK